MKTYLIYLFLYFTRIYFINKYNFIYLKLFSYSIKHNFHLTPLSLTPLDKEISPGILSTGGFKGETVSFKC